MLGETNICKTKNYNGLISNKMQRIARLLEVASGFEPLYEVLQTSA